MSHSKIAIIGAGLGGLCLAQGLKDTDVDLTVYERDAALESRTRGYRIRIDATGQQALARCLPTSLYEFLRAGATVSEGARLLGSNLSPVPWQAPEHWRSTEPGKASELPAPDLCVDRRMLREILMTGIEDRVQFGMSFEKFSLPDGDTLHVEFANGTVSTADLLVGADGANSLVRSQLLPDASLEKTDAVCIYGKTASSSALLSSLDSILCDGTSVIFDRGLTLIVDPMFFPRTLPEIAARLVPEGHFEPAENYIYWALIGLKRRMRIEAWPQSSDLPPLLMSLSGSWHPQLQALFVGTTAVAMTIVPVRHASPIFAPWPSGCVTLLGDAVHAMSPAAGAGANTALRDAAALADAIARTPTLHGAVSAYEPAMREWAAAAIHASIESTRRLCE